MGQYPQDPSASSDSEGKYNIAHFYLSAACNGNVCVCVWVCMHVCVCVPVVL